MRLCDLHDLQFLKRDPDRRLHIAEQLSVLAENRVKQVYHLLYFADWSAACDTHPQRVSVIRLQQRPLFRSALGSNNSEGHGNPGARGY